MILFDINLIGNTTTFKGSDTTSNILAINDANVGNKYYMYSTSGGWVNCGSGENLRVVERRRN